MKLSIITINRNNAKGLKKTLDSVSCQTWHDFEHIIVDGASTDGSVDIAKDYQKEVSVRVNVKVKFISEPDSGIYNAMNKGILNAQGEYCLFLNSGDYFFDADVLEKVFTLKNKEDFLLGQVLYGSDSKGYDKIGLDNLNFSVFHLFQCSVPHQACFIKRKLFLDCGGYDESYKIVSDLKFFYQRIIQDSRFFKVIDVVVSVVDDCGISSDLSKSRIEEDRLFLEFYPQRLLADYHDWRSLKEENSRLKREIQDNSNAIYIYHSIKDNIFLRKLHTLIFHLIKSIKR